MYCLSQILQHESWMIERNKYTEKGDWGMEALLLEYFFSIEKSVYCYILMMKSLRMMISPLTALKICW